MQASPCGALTTRSQSVVLSGESENVFALQKSREGKSGAKQLILFQGLGIINDCDQFAPIKCLEVHDLTAYEFNGCVEVGIAR